MQSPPSEKAALEPAVLTAPLEIQAYLRQLRDARSPLLLIFSEDRRFGSFVVEVERDNGRLAIDEVLPQHGDRLLSTGHGFLVETSNDGVRITWRCEGPVTPGVIDGKPCYWLPFPMQMTYHQRRNAFRAPVKGIQVEVQLEGDRLATPIAGQMIDLSATGCRLRFKGDLSEQLLPGGLYERLCIDMPDNPVLHVGIEVRHLHYQERFGHTLVGVRFQDINGAEQRQIERFVYQLQREARRFEKGEIF